TDDALLRKNFMLSHTAPFESQKRELQEKAASVSDALDSLPDNTRTSADVCFVTNLRLSDHTKLQRVHLLILYGITRRTNLVRSWNADAPAKLNGCSREALEGTPCFLQTMTL